MSPLGFRIDAPSRLHFGLLAWGNQAPRQFGSVGLMIEEPGLSIVANLAETDKAEGPLAGRALSTLEHVRRDLKNLPPLDLKILKAPSEHVGLGTGTALSLAVTRLALAFANGHDPSAETLSSLTGRGLRSGIGLHGSLIGGLLVDGGRSPASMFPPLLSRIEFPRDWSILIAIPHTSGGLAGEAEREAFSRLPGLRLRTIDHLCRLVLFELLPAVAERDLLSFGNALSQLQREVGLAFSPMQGGIFTDPQIEAVATTFRRLGLVGVGQSSWGPTVYGFIEEDLEREAQTLKALHLDLGAQVVAFWTKASESGAKIHALTSTEQSVDK